MKKRLKNSYKIDLRSFFYFNFLSHTHIFSQIKFLVVIEFVRRQIDTILRSKRFRNVRALRAERTIATKARAEKLWRKRQTKKVRKSKISLDDSHLSKEVCSKNIPLYSQSSRKYFHIQKL